ncbi:MAG: ABC transporter ATP-binding protein [Mangrovicoccus sp.]|nr:ABC transporter ATP-binding protein [Mangrovicoccus sp.]
MSAPEILLEGRASINGAPLFPDLRLSLVPGGWTCLLGPSGVGKSTILRLIAGLETGAEFTGQIRAGDGAPVADRIAYMAQEDLLLPWLDLAGNVGLGARLRGSQPDPARAKALITRLGLSDHIAKRPGALSGGQRQRVALARTLMEDRPIVLLDEPFSALDARTRSQMQDLAAEALRGRTVLLVTHDPAEAARLGARILLLSPNGLSEIPPPPGAVPRAVDDPETLRAQGQLLSLLRAA